MERPPYPLPLRPQAPWVSLVDGGGQGPAVPDVFPGEGWPSPETMEYATKLILLILLILALPHLVVKLLKGPGKVGVHPPGLSVGPTSIGG